MQAVAAQETLPSLPSGVVASPFIGANVEHEMATLSIGAQDIATTRKVYGHDGPTYAMRPVPATFRPEPDS